jgi:hypothetical protein
MLKLEKEKVGAQIHMCFRANESLFTPILWRAFGLAIAFHLIGIFIFHVQPFSITIFPQKPPVKLYLEPFYPVHVIENYSLIANESDFILPPPILNPEYDISFATNDKNRIIRENYLINTLLPESPIFHSESPLQKKYEPIKIEVSGELAETEYRVPTIHKRGFMNEEELQSTSIEYHVRVDSETGRIFWYSPRNSSVTRVDQKEAEKLLKELYFMPKKDGFEREGWVKFVFTENGLK